MTADRRWGFRTRALHAGGVPDATTVWRAMINDYAAPPVRIPEPVALAA